MARRGNPNWVRAAKRREVEYDDYDDEPEIVVRNAKPNDDEFEAFVSLLGMAAGALGIALVPRFLGFPASYTATVIGIGGGALAFGTKDSQLRQIGAGLAGAAIGYAAQHFLGTKQMVVRQADGEELFTRAQLQELLAAQAAELQKSHQGRNADGKSAATAAEPASENDQPSKPAASTPREVRPAAAAFRQAPPTVEQGGPGLIVAANRQANGTHKESLRRLNVIISMLTPTERLQLKKMIDDLPDDALAVAQGHLLNMSPEDAVQHLRSSVFSGRT